jgi:hypothetical protein
MARLDNNPTLLNALHNNTPFVYAHLVKFERPANTQLDASSNSFSLANAEDYAYLSDSAFDVVFNDGSKNHDGIANGPQTYVANKLISVGSLSDSSEVKVTSTNIVLDATPVDASLSDSIACANVTSTGADFQALTKSFSDQGFREGDTISPSIRNSLRSFRIDRFSDAGKRIHTTLVNGGTISAHEYLPVTITLRSEEITGLIYSSANDKVSFVNRQVTIYKAFFFADNPHTFIGTPVEIFKGVITNSSFEEDPEKGARVTWNLSNFLGDFRRVKGRFTSHEAHQGITDEGGVSTKNPLRPAYAFDRGFEHAEKSVSLLATFGDFEKEIKYKKKKILFGLLGSYKEPNGYNLIPVTREVDLRFDLQARYLPVVYGVQRVKGIPVFVDVDKDLTQDKQSSVFTANAICEGPIQSVLNIYIDDKPLSCMTLEDAKSRNPNAVGADLTDTDNTDVQCIGQADEGQVLQGTFPGAAFATVQNQTSSYIPSDSDESDGYENLGLGSSTTSDVRIFDSSGLSFSSGTTGITHEKAISLTTPMSSFIEIHTGLSDQRTSSILATQARGNGFKLIDC